MTTNSPRFQLAALLLATPLTPSLAQAPPTFTATRDLKIDALKAGLSRISAVAVSPHDEIVITQAYDNLVRFFSPAGVPVATLGRRATSALELKNIRMLGWIGDTFWIAHGTPRQTSFLTPDRKLVRTTTDPTIANMTAAEKPFPVLQGLSIQAVYPGGDLLMSGALLTAARAMLTTAVHNGEYPYVRTSADGMFRRIVGWHPGATTECGVSYTVAEGTRTAGVPFCARPSVTVAVDGSTILIVKMANFPEATGSYTLLAVGEKGDTLFNREYAYTPVAISRHVADSVRAQWVAASTTPQAKDTYRSLQMPSTFPPVRRAVIGRDGSIWLDVWGNTAEHRWRVVDRSGEVAGEVPLPANIDIVVADWKAATIWAGEQLGGSENVVRYRIKQ